MALRDAVERAQTQLSREVARPAMVDPNYEVEILRQIGLDPGDPRARAVVAVARRYGLDPVLGHIEIISKSRRPYITRDGYIHIAHASEQLDGMRIVDGPRRDGREWVATCEVWRKDMSHTFVYPGRADLAADNGPELAIARAERRALRRAFAVTLPREFDEDSELAGVVIARGRPEAPEPPATAPDATQAKFAGGPGSGVPGIGPIDVGGQSEAPADEARRPIQPAQRRALFAEATRLGFGGESETEREYRLTLWSRIIGREVDSSNALSETEASACISTMRNMQPGEEFAATNQPEGGNNSDGNEN